MFFTRYRIRSSLDGEKSLSTPSTVQYWSDRIRAERHVIISLIEKGQSAAAWYRRKHENQGSASVARLTTNGGIGQRRSRIV